MEKGQWGKVREPSLLLSNHPPLWEMVELFKGVVEFSKEKGGVAVMVDAAHLRAVEYWLGLEGIPIDVGRIRYRPGELGAYLRSAVTRKWGEVTGAYDEAFKGMEIVEQACDLISKGKSVFLCPAGMVGKTTKWRAGVGSLVREIYKKGLEDQVGVGLVCVEDGDYVLLPLSNMVDFVDRETVERVANNRRLAAIMQETWREKVGTN